MKSVVSSAPGKVVLCGEYAVLDGAPAIVMALDRRARVTAAKFDGGWHRVTAPGFIDGHCEFRLAAGGAIDFRRPGRPVDLSLVARILTTTGMETACALRLELDTRPFFHPHRRVKLGLGSSAALAVALTSALLHLAGDPRPPATLAFAAHRDFQGGRGSGVDVAAAVHGGVLAYRPAEPAAGEALQWPDGLRWALMWSGRESSTQGKIKRYLESLRGRPARPAAHRLRSAAERVLAVWRPGGDAILDALRAYTDCLSAFSVDHDLGIFDAGHRELHELAAACRLVYKPCGAGGGDIGIALANYEGELEEFVARAIDHGFERLDVALDPRGVDLSA